SVIYRDVNTSGTSMGIPIPVVSVTPLVDETYLYALSSAAQQQFGASKYLVTFAAQSSRGTYSYAVGPAIADRIRHQTPGGSIVPGNPMDQNPGDPSVAGHIFANPRPLDPSASFTGAFFRPPFD